jgi:D-arabinose 1-dehydrogenase-like Zn-dependent alcohol dehydrogenase
VITETYALDEIATAYERVPGYTVWSGLRWAEPLPGGRVAVVGNGGLGHLAIQYAKAAGFVMCTASATSRGLSEGSR